MTKLIITDRKDGSRRVQTRTIGKTRVKKSFQAESDINNIVKKYNPKLLLEQMVDPNFYGDFTKVTDLHSAHNQILEMQRKFLSLPSKVRKAFNNDPQQLVDTFNDPDGRSKLEDLGLLPKTKQADPVEPTPEDPTPNDPAKKTE